MVDVSNKHKNITVEVSNKHKSFTVEVENKSGNTNITASSDTSQYWANQSHTFADQAKESVQEAKHYAELANSYIEGFENVVTNNTNNIIATGNDYINQITETKNAGIEEITTAKDEAVNSVTTARSEAIDNITTTKTTILNDIEFVAEGEKKEIEELIDTGKDELKEAIGDVKVLTTLEIGDIGIAPLGIDETKGKRRYLNGQVIIQDQYTVFTEKLKKAIELYPSLACTESEWQTTATMTVGGQVGKFVVDDDAGTIRLPKIIMPIQGLTDLSKLGAVVSAGLPQHTHSYTIRSGNGSVDWNANRRGLCSISSLNSNAVIADQFGYGSNASNSIYGKSNTVQQEQIQYPYFIQVATGVETEDNIINEIELNNPFSLLEVKWSDKLLNNISWLRSEGQANSKTIYNDVYELILREYNSGVDETETVGGVSITFRRGSETNIKVTTNKSAYDSILSATGTAWYYVIDTANEMFYLPQSDGFFQFGGEGEFVEAGLPNITGMFNSSKQTSANTSWQSGAFLTNSASGSADAIFGTTGGAVQRLTIDFNASRSNPIYGNSNTVQPNAVKGYLYFYVGETVQNANLINAGRIEEKLADKVDTNASNFTADGKSLISGFAMPSDKCIDLTLGASGTQYTAPANGWLNLLAENTTTTSAIGFYVKGINLSNETNSPIGNYLSLLVPVKKGDAVVVAYRDIKALVFRFIYAEGEQ